MRFIDAKVCSLFLFLIFLTLPAFGAGVDIVPRITPQELNSMLTSEEEILVLDVRGGISEEKDLIVIKGAVRKALAELYRGEGLPTDKDKEIVTYCT